jgi:hypothetical protein
VSSDQWKHPVSVDNKTQASDEELKSKEATTKQQKVKGHWSSFTQTRAGIPIQNHTVQYLLE